MLSMKQAAEQLGCTVHGLRQIVDRSRARLKGSNTRGPTIKFFQASPHARVKFKPEWIEEYIDANTHDPDSATPTPRGRKPKAAKPIMPVIERQPGFNSEYLTI